MREHYRDMSADNMTADKSRKAAARTEPGTRWESLTGPHARLSICPEEIPAERIRTRWKALRASGRQRAHTDPERGNVLIINIIGTCPDICRQICHALRDGARRARPLKRTNIYSELQFFFSKGGDISGVAFRRECADNKYYRNMTANSARGRYGIPPGGISCRRPFPAGLG